ncbi:MAG: hypothetical protein PUP91_28450 [Rhizonema sp. PD37]|nr:hypothetical protein [Rhizonema sp. PD37]
MKTSAKILLVTVFVSTFGFGGFIRTTYAAQLPSYLVATPHDQSGIQVAEADKPNDRDSGVKEDGDTEASDVTTTPRARVHRSSQTKQQTEYHKKYHHTKRHHTIQR